MYCYGKEQLDIYAEKAKMLMATAAAMAAMQAAWPGLRELYQLQVREPSARQRAGRGASSDSAKAHEYMWITRSSGGHAWRCTRCFHTKAAVGGKGAKVTPCITAERHFGETFEGRPRRAQIVCGRYSWQCPGGPVQRLRQVCRAAC